MNTTLRCRLVFVVLSTYLCCTARLVSADHKIDIDSLAVNFGVIKTNVGDDIEKIIRLKNLGEAPDTILGVSSTCGCVVATYKGNRELRPGESGSIVIKLQRSRMQRGRNEYQIELRMLDGAAQGIPVTYEFTPELFVTPKTVDIRYDEEVDEVYAEVDVQIADEKAKIEASTTFAGVSCHVTPVAPRRFKVRCKFGKNAAIGDVNGQLKVALAGKPEEAFAVAVKGTNPGSFFSSPEIVLAGEVSVGKTIRRHVLIIPRKSSRDLKFQCKSESKEVSVVSKQLQDGTYEVQIDVIGERAGPLNANVRLVDSITQQELSRIPIIGEIVKE